ncbi:hypothetical protein AVEN_41075-1 [Araneus ventricosus]|uniref:Uncharacterized protein n=1 Tax=Araneus ventricosus TaxID=182803 RepID=A0A4Y2CIT9_ARAVE|nr:hypothetical protein AVEN_41075-1 [Araneus ventricosus]
MKHHTFLCQKADFTEKGLGPLVASGSLLLVQECYSKGWAAMISFTLMNIWKSKKAPLHKAHIVQDWFSAYQDEFLDLPWTPQ